MTYTDLSPFFAGANTVAIRRVAELARWNAELAAVIAEWEVA